VVSKFVVLVGAFDRNLGEILNEGGAMEDGRMRIERFDGKNFGFWKMQIEYHFYQKDLYLPLEEKNKSKHTSMMDAKWELLDRKALGVVILCLSASVAFNIVDEKATKGVMDKLTKMYEKSLAANKVYLMKRLFNMEMVEEGSIPKHVNEFNTITNQLHSIKIKFEDEVRALLLLCSLPDSWNSLVMEVSNSYSDSNKLVFDDVVGILLSEDMHRKTMAKTPSHSIALIVKNKGIHSGGSQTHGNGEGNYKGKINLECLSLWEKGTS